MVKRIVTNPLFQNLIIFISLHVFFRSMGNFVINDEWAHTRQVEAFLHGSWGIQANTDTSLILQALLGFVYSLIFGYSLFSMKFFVFLCSIVTIVGYYLVLSKLIKSSVIRWLALFLLILNPLFFSLSSVFMTDIPFLGLLVWSLYFFILSREKDTIFYKYIAYFLAGSSILVRQFGLVTVFVFFAYDFWANYKILGFRKYLIANFPLFILTLFFTAILFAWPRYGFSTNPTFIIHTIGGLNISERLGRLLSLPSYIIFFTLPLVFFINQKNKPIVVLLHFLLSIPITLFIFKIDVFSIGNILYLEGLYAKSYQYFSYGLLNNYGLKLILSALISFTLIKFTYHAITIRSQSRLNNFLILLFSGYAFTLFIPSDFYDRYLLPCVLLFTLLVITKFEHQFESKSNRLVVILLTAVYFFINFSLLWDFYRTNELRWVLADEIMQQTGLNSRILVNSYYTKYVDSRLSGDYTGLKYVETSEKYICAVEISHDILSYNKLALSSKKLDRLIDKYTQKPNPLKIRSVYDMGAKKVSRDNKLIIREQSYFSPLYSPFGYNPKVTAWCDKTALE